MSRLGQIYKHEKVEGGGVISTLSKRGKEKFDPRQFFDQDGLLANMLPGLFKSYKAIPKRKQYEVKYQRLNDINSNINVLKAITLSIAKNTSVLPAIQRDTNIMRQNLVNLVRKMGGKTASTTDEFFKNAQDREKFYEKQFEDKDKNSPEKVSDPNKKEGVDWMKWGILGGMALTGLAAYFTNNEFREKVNGMINSFGKTVFGEENWEGIKETITGFFKNLIENHLGKIIIGFALLLTPVLLPLVSIISTVTTGLGLLLGTLVGAGGLIAALGAAAGAAFLIKEKFNFDKKEALKGNFTGGVEGLIAPETTNTVTDKRILEELLKKERKTLRDDKLIDTLQERITRKDLYKDTPASRDTGVTGRKMYMKHLGEDIKKYAKKYPAKKEDALKPFYNKIERKNYIDYTPENPKYPVPLLPYGQQASQESKSPEKVGSLVDESLKNRKSSDGEVLFNKLMDEKGIEDKELRSVLRGLAITESTMNPNARGPVIPPPEPGKKPSIHVGDQAHGLFQIMPKTAEEMGYSRSDIKDPEKAARAGLEYFLKNYKKFGDSGLAVLAHHAGPGRVDEYLKTGKIDTKDLATGLSTNDYYKKVMKNAGTEQSVEALPNSKSNDVTNVQPQNDAPKSAENKKYPNILDIFDGIGSLVKNVPSEVSKEFPGVTKELEKGWGEMRSYAMKRLELPPVVVNNQQPQQPPSNQGVPQNLASISSVVDQDFIALLFNKSMWGSPTSSV